MWDFSTMECVGGAIQHSDKNGHGIRLQLKMRKIVKDDTGSGRGRLGENACGRREAAQK